MIKRLKNIIDSIYFYPNFYKIWAVIVLIIFIGYWYYPFFVTGKYAMFIFIIVVLFDFVYLFTGGKLTAERLLPEKLSNGDYNTIKIELKSSYGLPVYVKIIDELPFQFQKRDFQLNLHLKAGEERNINYSLRPVVRGDYHFGKLNVFITSPLRLATVKQQFSQDKSVKVYPGFIQMRKYELIALSNKSYLGVKKIRRLGHTMEFEQIKTYNKGDDYRTINWKATAKHNKLMVNQYQDEKSQNIYSIIDMGRTMQLPFNGMTLLDYSINSALAISNIAMKKKDKAGLITFEKRIRTYIKPDNDKQHLQDIFESLYAQETGFKEADFERLYMFIRHRIPTRSMLMLYTNFEHLNSLHRQLPFLKRLANKHLLVVIIFKNTELNQITEKQVADNKELYHKIIASDFEMQKRMMIKELRLHNIQTILTAPENLTTETINKYLALKATGLI
jgi:uncharacterized protein (DUF58 family)